MRFYTDGAKKTARLAICLSLSLIMSALELMLPLPFAPPGVKLGLANLVTLYLLYRYGAPDALIVAVLRVFLTGFLFGGLSSIMFALPGALTALAAMALIKRARVFTPVGASIAGGTCNNLAQLVVAALTVKTAALAYYLPILIASGALTGLIVGLVCTTVLQRTEKA